MLRLIARAAAGLALLTVLSACYLTNQVVIPADRAEAVPGITGSWKSADPSSGSEQVTISQRSGTNDYELTSSAPDAQGQVLLARAIKLNDTIYAVQLWDEAQQQDGVVLAFMTVDATGVSAVLPTGDTSGLATQAGVTVNSDGQALTVNGDPAAILNFIELHKSVEFTPPTPVMVPAG